VLSHPFRSAAAALAALGLLQASALATAAPQPAANAAYGRWSERDQKLDFEVRPGKTPNELVLVIPKDVAFPGSHQFVLAKRGEGLFEANDPGRPKVSLSVESASKAKLKVRGQGATDRGTWISMNDYTLVRR